jgi:hypothetical protein
MDLYPDILNKIKRNKNSNLCYSTLLEPFNYSLCTLIYNYWSLLKCM